MDNGMHSPYRVYFKCNSLIREIVSLFFGVEIRTHVDFKRIQPSETGLLFNWKS